MPELRRYIVKQEREVKVTAPSPQNAANIASRAFAGTKRPDDQINITEGPREISLDIREEDR